MKFKNLVLGVAASALFVTSQGYAALAIHVEEASSATSVTIYDEGGLDELSGGVFDLGRVEYTADLDTLSITASTGQAAPFSVFPTVMSLAIDGQTTAAGTATVAFTATGLDVADYSSFDWLGLASTGTRLTGGGVTTEWDVLLDSGNSEFGGPSIINRILTDNESATDLAVALGADDEFSLTLVANITVAPGASAADYDTNATLSVVPEPSILALFGAGLLGLGVARRRMKK